MATASTAGAWHSGGRPQRPQPARAPRPTAGAERPGRPGRPGAPVPGRAGGRLRAAEREHPHDRFDQPQPVPPRRPDRPTGARSAQSRDRTMASAARERTSGAGENRLRGAVAVLGVFLLTLAGAAVDSFVGMGLGTLTLVTLVTGTALATWLVRRRDLFTVVVAPPLVFALVAVANISLAPSATLDLPTMATLLVRGFPTMAVATAVAVVLAIVRLAARR